MDEYEKEIKSIKQAALTLAWFTRGGATYEDVLNMSAEERSLINQMAEEHFETTKKTQLPYF